MIRHTLEILKQAGKASLGQFSSFLAFLLVTTKKSFVMASKIGGTDSSKNATYINLYLTVQPALVVPDPIKEKLDCDESEELVQHCDRWKKELETKYQHRKVTMPS
jgi:hypothetical protein